MVSGKAIVGMLASLLVETAIPSSVARAQARVAEVASGSAQIENTVATGVGFNITTQTLTSMYVSGQMGDTVSLSTFASTAAEPLLINAVSVASTVGIATQTARAAAPNFANSSEIRLGDITILSKGVVSLALRPISDLTNLSLTPSKSGTFVVLAQFN